MGAKDSLETKLKARPLKRTTPGENKETNKTNKNEGSSKGETTKPGRTVKHGEFGKLCTSYNEFQKKDICGYEHRFKLPPNTCGYEHYCEACFDKLCKKESHKFIFCPEADK